MSNLSFVSSDVNQIKMLDHNSTAELICRVFPQDWVGTNCCELTEDHDTITVDWFKHFWHYLLREHPSDISRFTGLHVIPSDMLCPIKVLPLSETLPCIVSSLNEVRLSEMIRQVLGIFGVHVIDALPPFVLEHAVVAGRYVKTPTDVDILKTLFDSYRQNTDFKCTLEHIRDSLTCEQMTALIEVINNQPRNVFTPDMTTFLRTLPIFPSRHDHSLRYVSINNVGEATDISALPCLLSHQFVDVGDFNIRQVVEHLGVVILSVTTVLKRYSLDDVSNGKLSYDSTTGLMAYISSHFEDFKGDRKFIEELSNSRFVTTEDSTNCEFGSPHTLFDPEDPVVSELLLGKDTMFPGGKYLEAVMLVFLRRLGLKNQSSITEHDIYTILEEIHLVKSDTHARSIGHALLKIFIARPELLTNNRRLLDHANAIAWVPICNARCSDYPKSLQWNSEGKAVLSLVSAVSLAKHAHLVGSVCSIIDGDESTNISQIFQWDAEPPLDSVIQHLGTITQSMNPDDKAEYLPHIHRIYQFLANKNCDAVKEAIKGNDIDKWIWHGDGFVSMDSIFETDGLPLSNLSPFVYQLPSEMNAFRLFLRSMGVQKSCSIERLVKILHDIAQLHTEFKVGEDKSKDKDNHLTIAINILNHLKGDIDCLSAEVKDKILVPTCEQDLETFKMLPLQECTFCDDECKSRGFAMEDVGDEMKIVLVHPDVPTSTCELLNIPTLISRLVSTDDMEMDMFGQHESLTQRIQNLLADYSDGMAIFKEMIQNADDAGATEVKFMYDERTNADHCTYLIDKGMRDCQGPALWVYNNQVFSDEDFQNITKLGGATKATYDNKIGKFGLGFNAVYNVTDVPSFISRQNMVIFDPMTKYLGRAIKDKTQPGIKMDLKRSKSILQKLPDQFHPYHNVFGCDTSLQREWNYDGTLFRLPLRTKWQAEQSACDGISPIHYSRQEIVSLLNLLMGHGHDLLLFTQYVKKVSVYHLPADGDPIDAEKIITIDQTSIPEKLRSSQTNNTGFLTAVSTYAKEIDPTTSTCIVAPPHECVVVKTTAEISKNEMGLENSRTTGTSHWLITQCCGKSQPLVQTQASNDHLLPVAGVAVSLKPSGSGYLPLKLGDLDENALQHNTFCFLPLPIATGFPVHLNGAFAIEANRKHLSLDSTDEKNNSRATWNNLLLADAGVLAYTRALKSLGTICSSGADTRFHELWPSLGVEKPFKILCKSFYENLDELIGLPFIMQNGTMYTIEKTIFFESECMDDTIREHARTAFENVRTDWVVIVPPNTVERAMKEAGHENFINTRLFNTLRFYTDIFFPNISLMPEQTRDELLVYAVMDVNLEALVKQQVCIPVTPNGQCLKAISDLFHPDGKVARSKLYTDEDGRFPYQRLASHDVLPRLHQLGMKVDDVSWGDIIDRAKTVQHLIETREHDGDERLDKILLFMNQKLTIDSKSCENALKTILLRTPFLKVMVRPKTYPFPWKGDTTNNKRLLRPCELKRAEDRYLLSGSAVIADDKVLNGRAHAKRFLGLGVRNFTLGQVYQQLEEILTTYTDEAQYDREFHHGMNEIYSYLEENINGDLDQICALMTKYPSVLLNGTLVLPQNVAYNAPYDCAPFLCKTPMMMSSHRHLMDKVGVRMNFTVHDCVKMLQRIQMNTTGEVLTDIKLAASVKVILMLGEYLQREGLDGKTARGKYGEIYLPDSRCVLRLSTTLCYNECDWMNVRMSLTHTDIPQKLCKTLGVETARKKILGGHARGIPFGQKERLTTSLRRICESYPRKQVLKELIQNADDAGASEIHFVIDSRTHAKTRLFDSSWEPLQGPALCVYNDGPFTANDIEGIQRLGEGSKRDDPYRTGQYGVGFSSVYHITDAPSILAVTEETGKMLCVFDPHCSYVPGASPAEPGIRFDQVGDLEENFSDIFNCYLPEHFDVSSCGCLIRLPLRSDSMARHSEISHQAVHISDIEKMLLDLQLEACEILLFLKSLQKITVSRVHTHSGIVEQQYSVNIDLSTDQQHERELFRQKLTSVSKAIKARSLITFIPQHSMLQTLRINDSSGTCKEWCVSQVIGFKFGLDIPESISTALKTGRLGLVPIGGCAYPMLPVSAKRDEQSSMKAYCFLPTPEETGLPVHVNGHFALGQENRGQVWSDDKSKELKHAWNELLCASVIAQSYVNLIDNYKDSETASLTTPTDTRDLLYDKIEMYLKLFPSVDKALSNWSILARNVFKVIGERNVAVFPFIRSDFKSRVLWKPSCGNGINGPHFSENDTLDIKTVLLQWDAVIVESNSDINYGLKSAEVKAKFLTPENVIHFLRSSPVVHQYIPKLISETPFDDADTLLRILKYCVLPTSEGNQGDAPTIDLSKLDGLPLLLTRDKYVRVFSTQSPHFPPNFSNLLRQSACSFVDKKVWTMLINDDSAPLPPVFKSLSLQCFSQLLHHERSMELFNTTEEVAWSSIELHPGWIRSFWHFTWLRLNSENENLSDVTRLLGDWCFLPALVGKDQFLFPIRNATNVVFDETTEILSPEYYIFQVLKHFKVPCLDVMAIRNRDSADTSIDQEQTAKNLVITLEKPDDILRILLKYIKFEPSYSLTDNATAILRYFMSKRRKMSSCQSLRELPLFMNMRHEFIALHQAAAVYVISADMPTDGMDVFLNKNGVIFLLHNKKLVDLYNDIGCKNLTVLDFYTQFVFKHIHMQEYFTDAMISHHMSYLYEQFIREQTIHVQIIFDPKISRNQRQRQHQLELARLKAQFEAAKRRLLGELRTVAFLRNYKKELQVPGTLYSRENEVFEAMCPDKLVPDRLAKWWPYADYWHDFLRQVGVIHTIGRDLFIQFAKQLVSEASVKCDGTTSKKSRLLADCLWHMMEQSSRDASLAEASTIPFIVQADASKHLKELCPQYDSDGGKIKLVAFKGSASMEYDDVVWTKMPLLPKWADPVYACKKIENQDVAKSLHMEYPPSAELVSDHIVNVIHHVKEVGISTKCKEVLLRTFKTMYKYLHGIDTLTDSVKRILSDEPIILTTNQECLVLPRKTVVSLPIDDEIKPYLHKVPLDIAEYAELFKSMGSEEKVTVDQYMTVLSDIKQIVKKGVMTPNDVVNVQKAIVGLFGVLQSCDNWNIGATSLYMPDEQGHLTDVRELMFNDSPAYYTRLQGSIPFVADVKECGLKVSTVLDILRRLPDYLQPEFLSERVTEELVDPAADTTQSESIVYQLRQKLKSPEFGDIVLRLLHHEALTSQEKVEERELLALVKRLTDVVVYGVDKVRTQLRYRDIIPSSERDKLCFKHKVLDPVSNWHIYIQNNCTLGLDLLVPLSGIIDSIVDGKLRKSVLFLLPVLQCSNEDMSMILDGHNIMDDHSRPSMAKSLLPSLGTLVSEPHTANLSPVLAQSMVIGRYVCYRASADEGLVYGVVKKIVLDEYFVDIGAGIDIKATVDHLLQFKR